MEKVCNFYIIEDNRKDFTACEKQACTYRGEKLSIRLIASDLDGTLLTDCKELSPKTREVLDLAVQHGIYIVPATGRSFHSIPEMIRNYPGVEYVITANGGAVYSVREGKRVYQCLLEKESVEAAIAVRKEKIWSWKW